MKSQLKPDQIHHPALGILVPFNHAEAITLADLCKDVRADRGGQLSQAMAQKWARDGWRGLLLPTVELGRQRWLMRDWFDKWQAERVKRSMHVNPPPKPPRPRTALQLSKGHERAMKQLRKIGLVK